MSGAFAVAILGSGFAGSLLALIARKLGRSVVLVEKGAHPRFAIGESSSPLANLLLEELADRYDLPRIRPLAKWGTWQRTYPEIGCGLKRGFSFFSHERGRPFRHDSSRENQLLVAASPCDEIADTHWYRPDFDAFLVAEARNAGVEYLDETEIESTAFEGNEFRLGLRRRGATTVARARFLVDASGRGGALHNALGIARVTPPHLQPTQGLFTHFEGVRRLNEMGLPGSSERPPYPVDDAAVHHVFEGGWIWVLRFNNGLTSAGVAAADSLANEVQFSEGAGAWDRLLERFPTIRDQFAGARPTLPFVHTPRLPFRVDRAAGPGWALLPSAAAFSDPLLSTGFPLTLLGVERLASALEGDWGTSRFDAALAAHGERTLFEADTAGLLVGALYASLGDFRLFTAFSMLYFAAASFTEASRRLRRPATEDSFLLSKDPFFGPAFRACGALALEGKRPFDKIARAVDPVNVAGLLDAKKRNWYGVDAEDLFASAHKLGASREEIEAMLARTGFIPSFSATGRRAAGISREI